MAVHHGQYEELFAMASINFQDIKESVSTLRLHYFNKKSFKYSFFQVKKLGVFTSVLEKNLIPQHL